MSSDEFQLVADFEEAAWSGFRSRLADRLADFEADECLLIEMEVGVDDDELAGAAPYVQFMGWGEDMVRGEVVSNHYLDDRFRLITDDEARLGELGWLAPTHGLDEEADSGSANFHVDLAVREADRLAVMAARALREVFGCVHPIFLVADGLERDGEPDDPSAPHDAEAAAVFPEDAEHLQRLVDSALSVMFEGPAEHDEDGDLPITCGLSRVFVRVTDDHPAVEVFADVVIGVGADDRVTAELDRLNRCSLHRQLFLRDGRVVARTVLPAWPFAPAQLRLVVGLFCDGLDDMAAGLVGTIGGRRFLEPRPLPHTSPTDDDDARHVAMIGLLELLQMGDVPIASVAALFDHDRLELIRQLVAIRTGRQPCADLDEAVVLNHLRRALRLVVDRRARADSCQEHLERRRSQQLSLHFDGEPTQDTLDNGLWNKEVS